MARLRLQITMSLDGFVAGPDQSVEHPLGVGGEKLHEWAFPLRTFKVLHGGEGGVTGPDDDVLAGGADAVQQYLRAGLLDEMDIHVVPMVLGGGARLFDRTDGAQTRYESVRVIASPQVTHYKLRRRG